MSFNLKSYIKKSFLTSVGHQPDFWVRINALGWYEKGVLDEVDLAEIDAAIEAKNTPDAEVLE